MLAQRSAATGRRGGPNLLNAKINPQLQLALTHRCAFANTLKNVEQLMIWDCDESFASSSVRAGTHGKTHRVRTAILIDLSDFSA
jgi:hypothetical protein